MQSLPFPVAAIALSLIMSVALSPAAWAAPACSGEACDALSASADGCTWKNTSAKAVHFSLVSSAATPFSTVLGPGEAFKQTSKDVCASAAAGTPTYQATFATLRQMPDAPDFTLKPRPPAAGTSAAIAPSTVQSVAAGVGVPRAKPQAVAATTLETTPVAAPASPAAAPVPKSKPAPVASPAPAASTAEVAVPVVVAFVPPAPRAKPAVPAAFMTATSAPDTKPAAPAQVIKVPTPAEIEAGASPCGEACGDILFKVVDNCIWVQSQNPKPIMFQATIDGRMLVLSLEGASYEKSAKGGTPNADTPAYHTRQVDPFQQSSSAGIPVYRARLGDKGTCVKEKTQITQFVAVYRK